MKIAPWRNVEHGKTSEKEFNQLIRYLKPRKTDVFYDLGCADGDLCKWISPFVKSSIGVESHKGMYKMAVKNTLSSKYSNVKIIYDDFTKIPLIDATIIFSTSIGFNDLIKIKNETQPKTTIVCPAIPPEYPIKSEKVDNFFIFKTPYSRVRDEHEYFQILLGKKRINIRDVKKYIDKSEFKRMKWYIQRGNSHWKKLQK